MRPQSSPLKLTFTVLYLGVKTSYFLRVSEITKLYGKSLSVKTEMENSFIENIVLLFLNLILKLHCFIFPQCSAKSPFILAVAGYSLPL